MARSRHDRKIVYWDVKPQHKQSLYCGLFSCHCSSAVCQFIQDNLVAICRERAVLLTSTCAALLNAILIVCASSDFVSSSIPSWQILTAHAQPFRGARDLVFCLKVPLDSMLVWASSGGSGETARMHRLAWTFAARICDKYQIRLTRSNCLCSFPVWCLG